ncbi:Uncharacterized protein Adt_48872 [Abeliophyllum distichum]|uniref:Uncharacterized protein n=1 Tax=Abeliophyllum distichum TaxID=126358 RepID=A0ABD1NPU2_9LAMI
MGGGAWPFLSWWSDCVWLIPLTNEDLSLLTSYAEVHPSAASFLEGLRPFRLRKFEAITGIPSKRESSARVDYVPALCTHPPVAPYRLNGPVKCSDRGDVGGFAARRRREKSTEPYHLEEGEVVTRFP